MSEAWFGCPGEQKAKYGYTSAYFVGEPRVKARDYQFSDDRAEVTVSRSWKGQKLYDARYTFVAEPAPEGLEGTCAEKLIDNGKIWRFDRVEWLGNEHEGEFIEISTAEELLAMVQGGEHDMYAFPLTVISTLYNKGLDVRLMNVNTWGVTYFMTTDPDFTTWSDLAGKTVYIPLQSSPPDALTQYFLNEAGLTVGEDVEVIYASTAEVASLLASGQAEYATLIEPQVTSAMNQNSEIRRALSFEEEWQRVTGTDTMIPNAGFGTTQAFIDENPDLVAQFQEAYAESVQWVLDNPAEAAALAEEYLDMNAAVVEAAIPNMGLTFKSAQDAREELDTFYQLLNDFDPSMIGGALPDDGLYYAG